MLNQSVLHSWSYSLGLPLGLEAPVITPNGVIFLFFQLVQWVPHAGAVVLAVSSATGRGGKHGWLPDDLNNGRLDLFFLFLAGLHLHHLCADALPNLSAVVLLPAGLFLPQPFASHARHIAYSLSVPTLLFHVVLKASLPGLVQLLFVCGRSC